METADKVTKVLSHGTRKWHSRVRTGCSTCRSRRLKCDEKKPVCRRCESMGIKCYGLGYGGGLTAMPSLHIIAALPSSLPKLNSSSDVLDIIQLTPWTNSQVASNGTGDSFAAYTRARGKMLLSFVAYLPATAGHDSALDGAVKCVAMILKETYLRRESSASTKQELLALYTAALRELQDALGDSRRSVSAEVLCATQLLCFFECLRGETGPGSVEHSQGASHLIQYRGSQRFSTEFEKALLTNQMAMASAAAILTNTTCFLHTEEWLSVLEDCLVCSERATDRSELVLYHQIYTQAPMKIVVDITDFILKHHPPTEKADQHQQQQRLQLIEQLAAVRLKYLNWVHRLQTMKPMRDYSSRGQDGGGMGNERWSFKEKWMEISSLSRVAIAMMDRIHVAIGGQDALEYELAAQKTATSLKLLHSQRPRTALSAMNTWILKPIYDSILNTTEEWQAFSRSSDSEVASAEMLAQWLRMAGIRLP